MTAGAPRAAVLAVYVLLAFSVFTSLYDPLPDLPLVAGLGLFALPQVGLGLAVARWWAVVVPLVVALPFAIRGGDSHNALGFDLASLDLLALGGIAAALVLAGVLVATSGTPRLDRAARAWLVGGAALVAVALVPAAWATVRALAPLDERPDRALGIAARAGTVRGVGVGDRVRAVRAVWGPARLSPTAPIAPLAEDFDALAAPPFIPTPGDTHAVLRYRGASFLVSDSVVYAVIVSDPDAETGEGVGVGDNLALARDAYPALECTTGERPDGRTFPYCAGRLRDGRHAWFGDDPIRSITLASVRLSVTPAAAALEGARSLVPVPVTTLLEGLAV